MDHVRRVAVTRVDLATSLGVLGVAYTSRGVCGLEFPARRHAANRPVPFHAPSFLRRLASQLNVYARGKPVRFEVPLDLKAGTLFQQKVWRALRRIPHGHTRSYAWVADRIGNPKAARAVGAACGANPVPILVPCHRVIASDGSLGGFTSGLAWKRRLLALER